MLTDLELKPVYDSADCSLVDDLIVPLLKNSSEYHRGVGYFTSGWLSAAADGVVSIAQRGGHARFIVSPLLNEEDVRALETGDRAKTDEVLREVLRQHVEDLRSSLREDTRNVLAWLVAEAVLDFRIAVPRAGTVGDYHDKVGVFVDQAGNQVAIHGSFNDTLKGTLNGEAFSVFASWMPGQSAYVDRHRTRLASLWAAGNRQFSVYRLPEAISRQFIEMRTSDRPPYRVDPDTNTPASAATRPGAPQKPALRPYQQEAVEAWVRNGWSGIFEMATGTGKTVTALAAAQRRKTETQRLALVVLVPYQHLLQQWAEAARAFGFSPILCSSAASWRQALTSRVHDFRSGVGGDLCMIAVHDTAASENFARIIQPLPMDKVMLIADEVHGLGAGCLRQALKPEVQCRLGLSATPDRWYDEEGTALLNEYFGGKVFEFSMGDAIGRYLVPYEYHPLMVHLTPEEVEEWEALSARIAVSASGLREGAAVPEALKMLLIKRSRVLSQAEGKLPALATQLSELIREHDAGGTGLAHVLVYCAPGSHREVLRLVADSGLRAHEFVSHVPLARRQQLLQQFAAGEIQVLVAINCLDEGVDVPATRTAFFLASTTNPRQFVQRRGRILRLFEGKQHASVFDFVVMPDESLIKAKRELALSILHREMARFTEFSSLAMNEFEARAKVRPFLDACQALDLLDVHPWDIMKGLRATDRCERTVQESGIDDE